MKPGEANGKALGYIARGESRAQLRARWEAGELKGASPAIIDNALKMAGK